MTHCCDSRLKNQVLSTQALANNPAELDLMYADNATATLGLAASPEWSPAPILPPSAAIHFSHVAPAAHHHHAVLVQLRVDPL